MILTLPAGRTVVGSEDLTVSSTPKALTAATYQVAQSANVPTKVTASSALVSVETDDIRWSVNPAVTVSATENGHVAAADSSFWLNGSSEIINFRAIRTGNDATIRVTYFV